MGASTAKSPPTGRVMDVLATLADSPQGLTSAELAKICAISTSTCALVLAELEQRAWVARREDRRYVLGSGLFGLVHGLRVQFPLLDRGRDALRFLHATLGAGCSMSKIGGRHLTTVDAVGHGTDGGHAVGQRFPIDPPFGLVAMAWRDDDFVQAWLHRVMPRLTRAEIAEHQRVLGRHPRPRLRRVAVRRHPPVAARPAGRMCWRRWSRRRKVTRQLTTLMTMVTLQSVTDALETDLAATEFVVLPIFGPDGQPEYQIEIHLGRPAGLTLAELDAALRHAQGLLTARWPDPPARLGPCLPTRRFGVRPRRAVTTTPWLTSRHSFSFGDHYDPDNTHHGLLLVNNDDIVAPGTGFDTHPHRDMEIVTWVLQGELAHHDSIGNRGVIYPGLAQRMSAGSGILHSEKNDSPTEPVHFVQMWVVPDEAGIAPELSTA